MTDNPWLNIWIKPRSAIRSVIEKKSSYGLLVISAFYGFSGLIAFFQGFSLGVSLDFYLILAISVIFSPLYGYIIFSIGSFFLYLTGKWLGGSCLYKNVRAAVTWSNYPSIFDAFLWVVLIVIFKTDLFGGTLTVDSLNGVQRSIFFTVGVIQIIIAVWKLVLLFITLSEVQGFSIGKAIVNVILAIVVLFVIFYLLQVGIKWLHSPMPLTN
jgi:hypothetical protein